MSDSRESSADKKVVDLEVIKSETLKALRIAAKAQTDEGEDADAFFTASFAKQYLDSRYNNTKAKFKTLEGRYLIRGLEHDDADDVFVLDLIFAPKIISIADTKIRLFIQDGKFIDPDTPAEEEEK